VVNPTVLKRPLPPFGMVARSRNLFKRIVKDNPVGTFDNEAIVLLAAFCDTENQRYLATKKVEEFGSIIQNEVYIPPDLKTFGDLDKPEVEKPEVEKQYVYTENPWYKIMKETAASMGAISTKLRTKGVKTAASKPKEETGSGMDGLMFSG